MPPQRFANVFQQPLRYGFIRALLRSSSMKSSILVLRFAGCFTTLPNYGRKSRLDAAASGFSKDAMKRFSQAGKG